VKKIKEMYFSAAGEAEIGGVHLLFIYKKDGFIPPVLSRLSPGLSFAALVF
jgi:hypothetical protein